MAAVGGHGGPHGIKGTGQQLIDLDACGHSSHIEAAQSIYRGLQNDGADSCDGVLQAHGDPHGAQHTAGMEIGLTFLPAHTQDGVFLPHVEQTGQTGRRLGGYGGHGRSGHPHLRTQDEHKVQDDVQAGGQGQKVYRGFAVTQGTDDARQQVIQKCGGNAHEDDKNIDIGAFKDVRWGTHHRQNLPAQKAGGHSEDSGKDNGQIGGVGRVPAHLGGLVRPHSLGHRDGKAVAHPHAKADDKKVDGAGGAHRRQGRGPQQLAHNHGIHHVVQLLEEHPKQGGQSKAGNQPHGAPSG